MTEGARPASEAATPAADFIVIGAQKAGTTSLYRHLRGVDGLFLPEKKEINFYSPLANFQKGWNAWAGAHYADGLPEQRWGDISPNYLTDGAAADRIRGHNPNARLIASLRDPVDRAWSHYRMNIARERESRSFLEAVRTQLEPDQLDQSRKLLGGPRQSARCYVAWGEYGRLLAPFVHAFSSDQLLLIYLDDLEARPRATYRRILDHIGVPDADLPTNLEARYHVGVTTADFRGLRVLARLPGASLVFDALPRKKYRRFRLALRLARLNEPQAVEDARQRLRQHYRQDTETLKALGFEAPPWDKARPGTGDAELVEARC